MIKINKITPGKHKYLAPLTTISKSPQYIFFTGTLPEVRQPTVAIVGTRKPTRYGQEVTHRLAYELAKRGVVIVSGLALGTDSIAHRGALEAGGVTIAVLANSVDTIYPKSHQALGEQIITQGGAIMSEYEPPVPARNFQFLARNRIVSGLSDAVIITEAALRSGTLSTATRALEQGKDVFVVPGNITSPLSAGCNALLKQGAHPTTCAEDVLEVIAPQLLIAQQTLPLGNTPEETKIIQLLQSGIRDGDELQQASGIDAAAFSQTITMMELQGTLRALGGNQWALRS
ncbi:DNA-processing protein DprA [Streptomyces caniscabiei]|uniref:DNA-processing protein DprA n=1 Tax=Streptomyces caniscabiei TaxID=2746961 RepID=UPI0029B21B89|nr:DNA-processing protein DprA [Streptomyces caniscabiei]MDX2776158.1 DNA-processing protein DprA [Streptomyces caniscabiei]